MLRDMTFRATNILGLSSFATIRLCICIFGSLYADSELQHMYEYITYISVIETYPGIRGEAVGRGEEPRLILSNPQDEERPGGGEAPGSEAARFLYGTDCGPAQAGRHAGGETIIQAAGMQ
jgi:hypothetical protein